MLVVSDTSPISNLFQVGKLELLWEIYQTIVIPYAVLEELRQSKEFGQIEKFFGERTEIKAVKNAERLQALMVDLDPGEAEAIVLAEEIQADMILMDETKGRAIAIENGLEVTGLIGVLLTAKGIGLIDEVAPLLNVLEKEAGFWMGEKFRKYVLDLAGEAH